MILTNYQSFLFQIAKKDVDTLVSKDPPFEPSCIFIANWVSCGQRLPVELNLQIKLNGSQPSGVNFLVDVNPQRGAYYIHSIRHHSQYCFLILAATNI